MLVLHALALLIFLAPSPEGCLNCHTGIEDMHPAKPLTCTECHGGDPKAGTKEAAHVAPSKPVANDERTLPLDYDLPYERFLNPSNLRVAQDACGDCHPDEIEKLKKSLHGTTSGHLSDGLYENGVARTRAEAVSIFKQGALPQIPAFHAREGAKKSSTSLAEHYADLPRKACMQCHLWSRGRAVRGRLGMDGDYRGEGCAACHATYANDGLSRSGDPTVNKLEPGHPLKHTLTSAVPVDTCVHCHYGDATIGLNFRGLAQLPPGMPAGPDVAGSTKSRLNGVFYLHDPAVNPPDIHFERGMACIDCHTFGDVMGTGETPTKMESGVEIECTDCHGTFDKVATFTTRRGTKYVNVREEKGRFILKGKLDGKDHVVPQALDILTPGNSGYNPHAVVAMTKVHEKLECYACHSGWSPNFFGFHFDRNEQFTQLEVLSGERTVGRVTTQEKVFGTFRNLLLGVNPQGLVSPYLVGFSTMGTVHGKDGKKIIDQGMPRTAAGLSGMTLVHHQLHTVRPAARACVECHRNDEALGLGSPNFRLTRDFAFATSDRGLEAIGLDREDLEKSLPISTVPMKGARAVALVVDPVEAHARLAVVAREGAVDVVDVRSPAFMKEVGSVKLDDPRDVDVRGTKAYVAAGKDGLVVIDIEKPEKPRILARTSRGDARKLALAGFYAYVLDAAGVSHRVPSGVGAGDKESTESLLEIVDVADPASPKLASSVNLEDDGRDATGEEPGAIVTWWQWSRPDPKGGRTIARRVAAVATTRGVLHFVDLTEAARPTVFPRGPAAQNRLAKTSIRALAYARHFDLGSEGGATPSVERDYVYVGGEEERGMKDRTYVLAIDVSNPERPQPKGRVRAPQNLDAIHVASIYNPPNVQTFLFTAAKQAGSVIDASRSDQLVVMTRLGGDTIRGLSSIAVEEMAFDRLYDWDGRPEKDVAHPGARYLNRAEALRILRAPLGGPQ
jgi:hypothetical protein